MQSPSLAAFSIVGPWPKTAFVAGVQITDVLPATEQAGGRKRMAAYGRPKAFTKSPNGHRCACPVRLMLSCCPPPVSCRLSSVGADGYTRASHNLFSKTLAG